MSHHLTDLRGIPQDARLLTLAQHLVEVALIHRHPISAQDVCHQRRTLLFAHRRQLCLIADEKHPTVLPAVDKLHQVVEQTATAEGGVAVALIGNHRSLIHNKQRVAVQVVVQIEGREVASRLLPVDTAVDGISLMARIQ